jgi:hypothetical protein
MDLHLDFADGRMTGDGNDNVGSFLISGGYDKGSRECWWTKTYPGSHNVSYCGHRDGNGIWGRWEIPPWNRGGFHIWPRVSGGGDNAIRDVEADPPRQRKSAVPEVIVIADRSL